ncbi:MAG: Tetratricopeptide repeat protein [Parcubacteria group bacterium GW2011_GWA2_43_11]|nr:MAG: Tetratricopeptide repeat protein [Parcubacteria group bacterium GW2011_GWA2_43_11]
MFNTSNVSKTSKLINSLGYWTLLLLAFALPVCVLYSSGVPSLMTKIFAGGVLVLVTAVFFVIAHIRAQEILLPKSSILGVAWLIPIAYLLSTLFASSGNQSIFGERLTMDSLSFMLISALALTITAITLTTTKKALGIYLAMLGSATLLTLIELYVFFVPSSVQSFGLQSVSLVGTLNDLGVFFGLITIFVLLSLVLLPVTSIVRGVLWIVLTASVFFLTAVNLTVLWWIIGAFALAFFVYSISSLTFSKKLQGLENISLASLAVLLLSFLFIAVPPVVDEAGNSNITAYVAHRVDIGEFDVRPSWSTTVSIGSQAFKDGGLVFGTGPGTFYHQWARYMPLSINVGAFWLTDFFYGIGLVPTSIITTGLLGAIAWLVFFVVFIWRGARNLILAKDGDKNDIANYVRVTSFVAALYLWINTVIQVPSPTLVLYAALLTGVFIASLGFVSNSHTTYFKLAVRENPRVGFVATLCLTLLLLGSAGGIYGLTVRYIAEASYQESADVISTNGDILGAYALANKALQLHQTDVYYRLVSNIDAVRVQNLIAQNKPVEEIKTEFEGYLSTSIGNALEATKLDEKDYQNWVNLGSIYQSVIPIGVGGVVESAVAAYDEALALRPSSPSIYYAKAVLERSRGDNAKAREYVEKAITLRNQYTDAIFLLAQIQIEENDVENAINSVEAITLFNPSNAVAFFQLGLLHYGVENFAVAAQNFQRAVSISSDYANAHYFLGLSYWRLGNTNGALAEFKEVQKTNPENANVNAIIVNLEAGRDPFVNLENADQLQTISGAPIQNIDDGVQKTEETGPLSE